MKKVDRALSEYLDYLTEGMGRPERRRALAWYLTGLLLEGESKTVVAMASRLVDDDGEIEAMRQRLQQCIVFSEWADGEIRRRVAQKFEDEISPEAFVFDDTGFPKKGRFSVGVARQYSGTLGRVDNCQVATSLHVATDETSACIGMRLYLPEEWASDIARRRAAGVPDDVVFKRKWEIGLELLDDALSWGLTPRLAVADAGYGDGNRKPRSVSELAKALEYRAYTCPDGKGGTKVGRFGFARVRLAERRTKGRPPSDELWLIGEHRPGNDEYKFYICNLPATTTKHELARFVKLRWRVERDYQELKGEIGLDHFEGRTWRGFHHHVTLCAAAHGFLALQRRLFPPADLSLDVADGPASDSVPAPGAHRDVSALSPAL